MLKKTVDDWRTAANALVAAREPKFGATALLAKIQTVVCIGVGTKPACWLKHAFACSSCLYHIYICSHYINWLEVDGGV